MTLDERLRVVEDRLAIADLLATHPLSADTGDRELIEAIYADGFVFDRGPGLDGAHGRESMVELVSRDEHRAAIAGGLAHFGTPPLIDLDGDTAVAVTYLALITPDAHGESRELPNHGVSTGYRIHRVLANRWTLDRTPGGWRIASRTLLPADGTGPAVELLRDAGRRHLRADTRRTVERVFAEIERSGFAEAFQDALADDLVFTVTGSSPLAGRYTGKQEYHDKVLVPLHERLATPIRARLEQLIVDGEWATVRFRSEGVRGVDGTDFSMTYCWILRVVGGRITEITGFYDTKKMNDLFAGR